MEDNQENEATNGTDVPEIELIIKEDFLLKKQTPIFDIQIKIKRIPKTDTEKQATAEKNVYASYDDHTRIPPQTITYGEPTRHDEHSCGVLQHNMTKSSTENSNKDQIESNVYSCDGTAAMDFDAFVAEACDGLLKDIENDLELNLCLPHIDASNFTSEQVPIKKNSEALQMAVASVLYEGMSLRKAAKKYKVTASTLRLRVLKHSKFQPRKSNKELENIILEKFLAGESLSEISRTLKVAKSTVHQHKARLTKLGKLPAVLLLKKDREGGTNAKMRDCLKKAYRAYRINGMSLRFAAQVFSVPLTTLWRYIKRKQKSPPKAKISSTKKELRGTSNSDSDIKVGNETLDENLSEDEIKLEFECEEVQLVQQT